MTEPDSYERARDELADVVRRLEAGGVSLEESLLLWERGEELARICQAFLDGARERLDRVTGQPEDGTGSEVSSATNATRSSRRADP